MCGIAGFICSKTVVNPSAIVHDMVDTLEHRGPDDRGFLVDNTIAMGMRRLSIIDVAHGQQPVTSQDGTATIVFNGEIYNYREIRDELKSKGRQFTTHSDTETIVAAYKEWGEGCLSHLRGMFTFAIYDHEKKQLFIARDRIGIKPLYYYDEGGEFIFASEIKSILLHPGVKRQLSANAVDDYLALRYVPGPGTLFKNIKKFPPAHYVIWRDNEVHFKQYWFPHNEGQWKGSFAEAQEAFDELFDESTRIRMISEKPVGAFLSGGLDSSAIVTSLTKQFSHQINTFSVGFGWDGDELSHAAETARRLGCSHHEVVCTEKHTSLLPLITWHLDEPIGDGIILPMYLLSQLAAKHVTVVQSGEGADEILGGYFMHRVMRLSSIYSRFMPRPFQSGLTSLVKAMPHSLLNTFFDYPGDLGKAGKVRAIEFMEVLKNRSTSEQYRFLISLFSEPERNNMYTKNFNAKIDMERQQRDVSPLLNFNDMLKLQFNDWLPDDILCKQDKISMANSIEGRVPFMDHKLVELVSSFPASYKLSMFKNKLVLRNYLSSNGAKYISKRKKVPFYIPIDKYLSSGPLKSMVDELLSESSIKNRGIYNWEFIKNLRQAGGSKGFLFGKQIFSLAMLELWMRIYLDQEKGWI